MIAVANRYQAVSVSGAFTPTEIVNTVEAGADIVKLFPAELLGPQYVKSVLAPLAHAPVCPTGGVTPENVADWFAAGVYRGRRRQLRHQGRARTDGDYGRSPSRPRPSSPLWNRRAL